jgi:hypothetical protein
MYTRSVTDSLTIQSANSIAFTGAIRDSLDTLLTIAREAHDTQHAAQTAALLNNAVAPYRNLIRALDANKDYCAPAADVSTVLANIRGTLASDDYTRPALQDRIKNSVQLLRQCSDNDGVLLQEHVEVSKQYLIQLNRHITSLRTEAYATTS